MYFHFNDRHVVNAKGSDCYDRNFETMVILFEANIQDSDESNIDTE